MAEANKRGLNELAVDKDILGELETDEREKVSPDGRRISS